MIPENVKEIGSSAFYICENVTKLFVSEHTKLNNSCFLFCKGLADEKRFVIVHNVLYGYYGEESEVIVPESVRVIRSKKGYPRGWFPLEFAPGNLDEF